MATERWTMAIIRAVQPSFRSRHDKVAFAIHAAFLSADYVRNLTGAAAFSDDVFCYSAADEVRMGNWNEIEDNYAFLYSRHEKGSKKVLLKSLAMNDKLLVDALKEGDSEPLHLEVNVREYVEDNGGTNYDSQFKNLRKLVADVNEHLMNKLGTLDGSSAASSSSQPSSSEKNSRDEEGRPDIGVADPEERYFYPSPSVPFFESDLLPRRPGDGVHLTSGDFGDGSMKVGPEDPTFFVGREPRLPEAQPDVPPRARFDPPDVSDIDLDLVIMGLLPDARFDPLDIPEWFISDPRISGRGTHPDSEHFPDDSEHFPDISEHFADVSEHFPDISEHFPDVSDYV